jgi:hypothetical protein
MEQIVREDRAQALKEAKILAKTTPYVVVILSEGKYYIETEATMIRTWETVIAEFEDGQQINRTV